MPALPAGPRGSGCSFVRQQHHPQAGVGRGARCQAPLLQRPSRYRPAGGGAVVGAAAARRIRTPRHGRPAPWRAQRPRRGGRGDEGPGRRAASLERGRAWGEGPAGAAAAGSVRTGRGPQSSGACSQPGNQYCYKNTGRPSDPGRRPGVPHRPAAFSHRPAGPGAHAQVGSPHTCHCTARACMHELRCLHMHGTATMRFAYRYACAQ